MSLGIILGYLVLLLLLGVFAGRLLRMTGSDYFLASRGIGPFMLLMSVFGTTMTAFALVGSTGKTFEQGIGVYGLMASWSGIIHSAVFFLIGARIWALGKKHGYVTQLSFFRDRYQSDALVLLLFPAVVGFVMIYVLMGVIGAGRTLEAVTPETWSLRGVTTAVTVEEGPAAIAFPEGLRERLSYDAEGGELVLTGSIAPKWRPALLSLSDSPGWRQAVGQLFSRAPTGALPYWAGMALICLVVLFYVFFGGMRATAWANTMQTLVFMVMGIVAFVVITRALDGPAAATAKLSDHQGGGALRMTRGGTVRAEIDGRVERIDAAPGPAGGTLVYVDGQRHFVAQGLPLAVEVGETVEAEEPLSGGLLGKFQFLTYCFIPLSVGMFPHLFQHWLTARRASNFKLTVVAHPLCIMITWVPCVLLGMWASGILPLGSTNPNSVLGMMVSRFSGDVLAGFIGAGILAAIMSSMDSQFLCVGSLFTNDIAARYFAKDRITDRQRVLLGRGFVIVVVTVSYLIGLFSPQSVFDLGVWCFTGFASLFPLVFCALYWKRSNKYGAMACVLTVAVLWTGYLPKVLGQGEFLLLDKFGLLTGSAAHEGEFLLFHMMPVTFILAASTTAMVVVTLLTPAPDAALVEKFFPSARREPLAEADRVPVSR